MSKSILFIISSYLLIEIIYCDECLNKCPFSTDGIIGDIDEFKPGYIRNVWHHADSCNSYQVQNPGDPNTPYSCCYIHVEFRSLIDGERYDQYGCIDVLNPWEDYDGGIGNVTDRTNQIIQNLKDYKEDGIYIVDQNKNLHVKILCSANYLKLSLFSLLVLILF